MLTILRHIIQEVSSAQDFREALEIVVMRVAATLNTDSCSIFLLDKQQHYVLAATQGLNKKAVGKIKIAKDQGLIGLIAEREEPINIEDATQHPNYISIKEAKEEAYRALLGAPIIFHRRVLGVLIVEERNIRRYTEAEESFLVTLATQVSSIIAHADTTGTLEQLLTRSKEKQHEYTYAGLAGSPGIGIGHGVIVYKPLDLDTIPDKVPEDIELEIKNLNHAFQSVRDDLQLISERLHPHLPVEERALFDVYQRMLDSSALGNEIIAHIREGNWAPGALREVIQLHVRRLENLNNEYMQERTEDIKDLGVRILSYLQKSDKPVLQYAEKTILIGEVLTPNNLAEVPEGCLMGVICGKGSSNSHVAILARAMKVPTIMGLGEPIYDLQDKLIIVDGYFGQIYISPTSSLCAEFERLLQDEKKLDATFESIRELPCETKDGKRISLLVNTGLGADISISLNAGSEGVGLYRTEVPFLLRDRFPTTEEQRIIYRQLLASFAPQSVKLRMLDIGGDKPLPYFPIKEDNPFLGWRGIRITLDQPEIFLSQAGAMLRASEGLHNMEIMFPMITEVNEVDEAIRLLKKVYEEVKEEGFDIEMPKLGVMIEVPSAVYQVREIAKRVDFLSVGTNDLTQYLLAVDRNNPRVANLYDWMHPSVLKALVQIVTGGHQEKIHVSICGEMAGDPIGAVLLFAMGFDSLSMNASSIARVKYVIRHFTHKKAVTLLKAVLKMENTSDIHQYMEEAFEKAKLSKLIRAGR